MRKLAGIVLAVMGLVIAAIGVGSATIWSPDPTVTASTESSDAAFLWTDPGVLDLVNTKVTVSAKAADPEADVTIAIGYSDDVEAWASGLSAGQVTGLSDWETLAVTDVAAEVDDQPSLASSDNWLDTATAAGSTSLAYTVTDPGQISAIVSTSDGSTPTVTLTWERHQANSAVLPLIVIGILVTAIGCLLLAVSHLDQKREEQRHQARVHSAARRASRAAAETAVIARFEGGISTSSREVQTAATGHAFGAGILGASPRTAELRTRELPEEARLIITQPEEPAEPDLSESSDDGVPVKPSEDPEKTGLLGNGLPQDVISPYSADGASAPSGEVEHTLNHTETSEQPQVAPATDWRHRWGLGGSQPTQKGNKDQDNSDEGNENA